MVDVVVRSTPFFTETGFALRPISGVVIHDTETDGYVEPHAAGSWHYLIDRNGTGYRFVDEADVAWHVRACDRWWPAWLPRSSPWAVSPANAHTVGVELVSSQRWRNQGRAYTAHQVRTLQALLLDLRGRYGGLPVVGHGHVQADRSDPVWLDWATVLPVLPETDAVMPLEGARRTDPLLGGFAFVQWTGSVFHPGVDLNQGATGDADLGKPVRTPAAGTVRFAERWDGVTRGEGTHVWLEAADGHWLHFDHLHALHCEEGETLAPGELVGSCGKSGGWPLAHVHWEVAYRKPASWWQWTNGWTKARVLAEYMDPFAYLCAVWPTGESGGGGGTVDEPVLSDAELAWKLQPALWGEHFDPAAVDFAIPKRWRAEFRLGNQLGRPRGPEVDVPDVPGARMQEFEDGRVIVYRDGRTSLVG